MALRNAAERQDLYRRYSEAVKRMDARYDPILYGRGAASPEVQVKLGHWVHERWMLIHREWTKAMGYD